MKLYELLSKYSNEEILEGLHKQYKEDIHDESYISALNEIRDLQPSKEEQDTKIIVDYMTDLLDDNKKYITCDGIGADETGKIIRWGLEFDKWEDWLAKDIDDSSFDRFDKLTVLTSILWEMTFNGYSQECVQAEADELDRRYKEAIEHPESLTSLDGLEEYLKDEKED